MYPSLTLPYHSPSVAHSPCDTKPHTHARTCDCFRALCSRWRVHCVCGTGVAWHASASDAGTVRIYERSIRRSPSSTSHALLTALGATWHALLTLLPLVPRGRYTGLTVTDRFTGWNSLVELITPFGWAGHAGSRKYTLLREQAESGVAALAAGMVKSKKRRLSAESGAAYATIMQQGFRRYRARKLTDSGYACLGWLLKTGSGSGPLDKLREALVLSAADGGLATSAATAVHELVPAQPRFVKFFVLNERRRTLQIYAHEGDFYEGQPARYTLANVRACAVLRLEGSDGRATLALLPSAIIKEPGLLLATSSPARPPVAAGAGGGGEESEQAAQYDAGISKGWYLRAADDAQTQMWLGRLCASGARKAFDYKVSAKPKGALMGGVGRVVSAVPRSLPPPRVSATGEAPTPSSWLNMAKRRSTTSATDSMEV